MYKLHRLPSSPPGELAILEEVSATIPSPSQAEEETLPAQMQPSQGGFYPSQIRRPHQKRETSLERSLDRVHEAHQKALSATAALEEEMERLHQMRGHSQSKLRPQSRDRQSSEGRWEERCHLASEPVPSQSINPDMLPGKMGSEDRASDLGEPPELKAEVASFLEGSSETSDCESEKMPLEPAVSKFAEWVR